MELYLFRHGEAETPGIGGDEPRELTEKGRKDTSLVVEALLRAGVMPEAIWTSPLVRARQTAEIAGRVFGVAPHADARLRPGATLGGVQDLVGQQARQRVILVGHEPDMSVIVSQLTGARVRMRTGGLARVDLERVEPGKGTLVWLVSAELFG